VQIICLNCGNRFGDVSGDLRGYHCAYCGSPKLVRVQSEDERRRDALLGLAAGAAIGAEVGGPVGALIGGLFGALVGALRTPRLEDKK
jgi:DNA-directed RNA polymerase subunit RPC12/RpoP